MSGRALYGGENNRALYSPLTGRALYGVSYKNYELGAWPNYSACFYGGVNLNGNWSLLSYQVAQDTANSAMLSSSIGSPYVPFSRIMAAIELSWFSGVSVFANEMQSRFGFIFPANAKGKIVQARLTAKIGAGKAWERTDKSVKSGAYNQTFANLSYDGMGIVLDLYASESANEYSTGGDMAADTPLVSVDLDDVNSYHIAQTRDPCNGGANIYPSFAHDYEFELPGLASALNGYSGNTVFLWAYLRRDGYFPYLNDYAGAPFDDDFLCLAELITPKLLLKVKDA
jgi:hypothetical protein